MASRDTLDDIDILAFRPDKSAVWPLAKAVNSTALYHCHSGYSLSDDAANDLPVSMDWKGEVWRYDSDTTITGLFLLLARYVPNVAKRRVYEISVRRSIYWGLTDRSTDLSGKFQMAISPAARGHPIHFMFGSTVRFSGWADISGFTKFSRYVGENNARGVIRLVTI